MMRMLLIILCALLSVWTVRAEEGMWLPSLLKDGADYSDRHALWKDAVVGLGTEKDPLQFWETGSLISNRGLVLTQKSEIAETQPFLSSALEEEQPCQGTTASLLVRMEEVTNRVNTERQANPQEPVWKIFTRIEMEAMKGNTLKARVTPMYSGNRFFLFVYQVYSDVRVVYTDTAGFSLLRIYTALDGSAAPYAAANIPLASRGHFPLARPGVKAGRKTTVLGFPEQTSRYTPSSEVNFLQGVVNRVRKEVLSTKARIAPGYRWTTEQIEQIDAQNRLWERIHLLTHREKSEQEFTDWVNADPERQRKYGEVLSALTEGYQNLKEPMERLLYTQETGGSGCEVLKFASVTGNALKNNLKPNIPDNLKNYLLATATSSSQSFFRHHDMQVERAVLAALLQIYDEHTADEQGPALFNQLKADQAGDYAKMAGQIMDNSVFTDSLRFQAFFAHPDAERIFSDPAYVLSTEFFRLVESFSSHLGKLQANIARQESLWKQGLMEMNAIAPDADGTLRLSYGKVGTVDKFHFFTNNDVASGCCGAPVLDKKGRLVGMVATGDFLARRYLYEPEAYDCKCLAIQAVVSTLKQSADLRHLLAEISAD